MESQGSSLTTKPGTHPRSVAFKATHAPPSARMWLAIHSSSPRLPPPPPALGAFMHFPLLKGTPPTLPSPTTTQQAVGLRITEFKNERRIISINDYVAGPPRELQDYHPDDLGQTLQIPLREERQPKRTRPKHAYVPQGSSTEATHDTHDSGTGTALPKHIKQATEGHAFETKGDRGRSSLAAAAHTTFGARHALYCRAFSRAPLGPGHAVLSDRSEWGSRSLCPQVCNRRCPRRGAWCSREPER
eukprot:13204478-Alexandrium_andersonii.AAC.1